MVAAGPVCKWSAWTKLQCGSMTHGHLSLSFNHLHCTVGSLSAVPKHDCGVFEGRCLAIFIGAVKSCSYCKTITSPTFDLTIGITERALLFHRGAWVFHSASLSFATVDVSSPFPEELVFCVPWKPNPPESSILVLYVPLLSDQEGKFSTPSFILFLLFLASFLLLSYIVVDYSHN